MTITAPATSFAHYAKVHQALVGAKLENDLTVRPEPDVLQDMLGILVSVGILTPEQAAELLRFILGGVAYPLPPLPGPDPQPGKVDPYQIIRVATLVPREALADSSVQFDVVDDVVAAVVTAIVDHLVPVVVQAVGDAIDAVGSWLSGLFS